MDIKIVLFLTIILYSVIVSQSFSYIISLRNVQLQMTAVEYMSFRKQTDKNFQLKFRFVIYASLLCNLLLTILSVMRSPGWLFICSIISLLALIADTLLAVKANMPINNAINNWTAEQYPPDWAGYRTRWLVVFSKRQVANLTGFVCLLAGAVFY